MVGWPRCLLLVGLWRIFPSPRRCPLIAPSHFLGLDRTVDEIAVRLGSCCDPPRADALTANRHRASRHGDTVSELRTTRLCGQTRLVIGAQAGMRTAIGC